MIVVDIETSGTDPYKHSILSIGAVDFSNAERFFYQECKIEEGKIFEEEALKINGFSEKQIKDPNKKDLESILKDFIIWIEPIKDRTIAGHNVTFDARFLNTAFKRYGIDFTFGYRVVDTHSLTYASLISKSKEVPLKNGRTDITSDYVFNYVGLPEETKPHNALNGAKMEAEAISRLVYGKGLLESYKYYNVPEYLIK